MRDSAPEHNHMHTHTHDHKPHTKRHSSISSSKSLSLHYPSVFGSTPMSPSNLGSFDDHHIPKSLPDLTLSEDEDLLNDDFDIPELSLGQNRGLPILP